MANAKPAERKRGRMPGQKHNPLGGTFVTAEPDLAWGGTKKQGFYLTELRKLESAPSGHVLEFAEIRVRSSIVTAAKKYGINVEFAEAKGKALRPAEICWAEAGEGGVDAAGTARRR